MVRLVWFPGYMDWERRKYTWEIRGQNADNRGARSFAQCVSLVYMKNSYRARNSCTKHQDKGKKRLAYSLYSALALCQSVGGAKQRTFEHTFVSTTASHSASNTLELHGKERCQRPT